ncbi:MAG TPA: DUF5718 family protein [Solirubrobacteraceae bacterium]|nr:DUF5718 family protein [Solirubrobacteraceae bacterium]
MRVDLEQLRGAFGFGVAGNFAGHLEQAGEAADFTSVTATTAEAPKGIFPWYVPGGSTFLGTFPLSHDTIAWPDGAPEPVNLQIEPEVGVLADVAYDGDGSVTGLQPRAIGAFNDCSIRRPGAPKISVKKNWGAASKGVAADFVEVGDLEADGATRSWRLASFLRRDGQAEAYGVDSPLPGYSYYGTQLFDWIVDRLHHQRDEPGTPLEDVGQLLRDAGRPERVLIGIGATRYTELGASTYLQPGDESLVVVYDGARASEDEVASAVARSAEDELAGASVLRQRVR